MSTDSEVTYWAEDDDPEQHIGEDLGDNSDTTLKMAGVVTMPAEGGQDA